MNREKMMLEGYIVKCVKILCHYFETYHIKYKPLPILAKEDILPYELMPIIMLFERYSSKDAVKSIAPILAKSIKTKIMVQETIELSKKYPKLAKHLWHEHLLARYYNPLEFEAYYNLNQI